MNTQKLPDNPTLTDTDDPPRPHVRRKKSLQDWITTISALLGVVAAIGVFMGSITDALPFVQKPMYSADKAANDIRVMKVEAATQSLHESMATIQRNGLLTLQLQLQQRIDALSVTLKKISQSDPNYYQISATISDLSQQVDEIRRQLRR